MIALDSNVLVYAEGLNGDERKAQARALLARLNAHPLVVPVQCLGETYRVLTGKGGWDRAAAMGALGGWIALCEVAPTTAQTFAGAAALSTAHGHQIWDAIILEAAAEAGCVLLLSEDMHDGFVYRGVTVANPFAAEPHPLLASLLEDLP